MIFDYRHQSSLLNCANLRFLSKRTFSLMKQMIKNEILITDKTNIL